MFCLDETYKMIYIENWMKFGKAIQTPKLYFKTLPIFVELPISLTCFIRICGQD